MIKRVAALNDLSGLGRCSLTAAIPVLAALGAEACPVPTAVLTGQTGFPGFYMDDYTQKIDQYINHWSKLDLHFDGIYTGFLANAAQADKIYDFLNVFKKDDTLLLIDPVMGDNGRIYPPFTQVLCEKLKTLSLEADVITPNLTEACILAGKDYNEFTSHAGDFLYLEKVTELGLEIINRANHPYTAIITGINHKSADDDTEYIYNAAITGDKVYFSKTKPYGCGYSGTGDIFASVICGYLIQGRPLEAAVSKAAEFIEAAAFDACLAGTDRNYGINFEKYLYMLINDTRKEDPFK